MSGARHALEACAAGRLPPNVALMHLHMHAPGPADALAALDEALAATTDPAASARLQALAALARSLPGSWDLVRAILGAVSHDPGAPDAARMFDRAAAVSPEAAVALYTLGDPGIAARATDEVVGIVRDWAPRGGLRGRHVLDLGCGEGRIARALVAEGAAVTGTDVSQALLEAARRRVPQARLVRIAGADLGAFRAAVFDLAVAVDVFPYVGAPGTMLREITRVLRPGGACAVFNFTYRGDPDEALQAALAGSGLAVGEVARGALRYWDAIAWRLVRVAR